MSLTRRNVLVGAAAAVGAQGVAYLLYRYVTRRRAVSGAVNFEYEATDPNPRGLDASLQLRQGGSFNLRGTLGQPILVHFWATWCEPCRTELPQLLALTGPRTLLVSVDEAWPVVDHFFDGNVPTQVVLDAAAELRRAFAIGTLPDTYLLDAQGCPLARFHGPRAWNGPLTKQTLENLVQTPNSP